VEACCSAAGRGRGPDRGEEVRKERSAVRLLSQRRRLARGAENGTQTIWDTTPLPEKPRPHAGRRGKPKRIPAAGAAQALRRLFLVRTCALSSNTLFPYAAGSLEPGAMSAKCRREPSHRGAAYRTRRFAFRQSRSSLNSKATSVVAAPVQSTEARKLSGSARVGRTHLCEFAS
jgi:hypothetical protein